MKEFFQTLFNPGEGICSGDFKATEVNKYAKEGEFFCVNPLDLYRDRAHFLGDNYDEFIPRRADLNVTCFRNFIFEMDSIPTEDQLKIFRNSNIPFTSIVFSGGKSYHAILSVEPRACQGEHTLDGVETYKHMWKRLAARIDKEAKAMGYSYPDGKSSFVDQSCKNPSRLTRYPEVFRSNGNHQDLVQLTERMLQEDFLMLLSECPVIYSMNNRKFETPENEICSIEQFEMVASPQLKRKLKIVDWAGSEGMYPYLFQYSLWAIDETNVAKETFVEYLDKYTFKSLIREGYPAHKLQTAVDHAFSLKGK